MFSPNNSYLTANYLQIDYDDGEANPRISGERNDGYSIRCVFGEHPQKTAEESSDLASANTASAQSLAIQNNNNATNLWTDDKNLNAQEAEEVKEEIADPKTIPENNNSKEEKANPLGVVKKTKEEKIDTATLVVAVVSILLVIIGAASILAIEKNNRKK